MEHGGSQFVPEYSQAENPLPDSKGLDLKKFDGTSIVAQPLRKLGVYWVTRLEGKYDTKTYMLWMCSLHTLGRTSIVCMYLMAASVDVSTEYIKQIVLQQW